MTRRYVVTMAALAALALSTSQARANLIVPEAGANDVRSYSAPLVVQFLNPAVQPGNLTNPIGVAIDGAGTIDVVNNSISPSTNQNSVAKFTPTLGNNGFLVPTAASAVPGLAAPYGIAFDNAPTPNAYVTNEAVVTGQTTSVGFVQQVLPTGAFGTAFGLGSSHLPAGVAFTTAANPANPGYNLFVAENGAAGSTNPAPNSGNTIQEYNTSNLLAVSPTLTSALLNGPVGLAFSPDGKTLYVVNNGNSTIATYSLTLGTFAPFTTSGVIGPVPSSPIGITTDPSGNVYVSYLNGGGGGGQGNGTVLEYNSSGAFVATWATNLNNPAFLAFQPVPEPSSVVMMGLGLGLTGFVAYRRKRKAEAAA